MTILKRAAAGLLAGLTLAGGLGGCSSQPEEETGITIAATTYPVYLLASAVAEGAENITIVPVVNQSVACLHDYTLTVTNMKTLEKADLILLNGAGLEDFMEDALAGKPTIDCSQGIELLYGEEGHDHDHDHDHNHEDEEIDPHIWMDPDRAAQMAENIAAGLAQADPDQAELYLTNGAAEAQSLHDFAEDCRQALSQLSCRQLITFHEGFAYLADSFDLEILAAIEEESGSEASAKEIVEMVRLIEEYGLPAIFVERNGSDATALAIQRECGVEVDALTMMMSGPEEYGPENNYQTYLTQNVEAIKEALS